MLVQGRLVIRCTDECFFSQSPRNCLNTHEGAIVSSAEKETICYIPSESKWYELAEKLSRRDSYKYGMSSLHGKLYVIGGCRDQNGNIAEYYDPSRNLLTPVIPKRMPGKILPHFLQRDHLLLAQLSKEKCLCLEHFAQIFEMEIPVKFVIQKPICGVVFLLMLHVDTMQVLQILLTDKYLLTALSGMCYSTEEGSSSCMMLRKTNGNPFQKRYFI